MKLIYVHHAERDVRFGVNQENDITENGVKQALLVAENLKNVRITAIYSSQYKRCKHTAEIINQYHNLPIYEDERFNEAQPGESWNSVQQRNMDAIDVIVNKSNNDDIVLCVTSGVNVSAFIFYILGIKASEHNPWIQAGLCSPLYFTIEKRVKKK